MFELDERLERDTFPIANLPLCQLLLMNNRLFPWLILVPAKSGLVEIVDLEQSDRIILMQEISAISRIMQELFTPYKLNIAALGNQVRQLHIHIIARSRNDAAWPNPVWGTAAEVYREKEHREIQEKIKKKISVGIERSFL